MSDAHAELPASAVLVHIGPYKTGSTSIQFSLHKHRDDLLAHGVLYPGDGEDHRQRAAGYALLRETPSGVAPPTGDEWADLVAQVRSTRLRVCISTEDLASAGRETIRSLVRDLGADRVHVLIVVRRLDKVLPSAWQERVKTWNETLSYEDWLREVLAEDPSATSAGRRFWHNHSVSQLLGRWTAALPPERCILAMADEQDRGRLLRTFERLLGLPHALLTPGDNENTSLPIDRVELLRQVNVLRDERGWDDDHRRRLVYRGLIKGLREAPVRATDVPTPPLPGWAAERIALLNAERAAEVSRCGATVIGDPRTLCPSTIGAPTDDPDVPQWVSIETAARGVEAVLEVALRMEARAVRASARPVPEGASPVAPSRGTRTASPDTSTVTAVRRALRVLAIRAVKCLPGLRRSPSAR